MHSGNYEEFRGDVIKMLDGLRHHANRLQKPATRIGSQAEEDAIISDLIPTSDGVYIDIGASHPIECSNTWALYQKGWRGLLIEPLHANWPDLLRQRPGDLLCPYAVMNYSGYVTLRVAGSVSSVRKDWNIEAESELVVECDRMDMLLARYPTIRDQCSVMSIDVEGVEKEVIQGADFSLVKPKVLIVEKVIYDPNKTGKDISGEWQPLLIQQGFKLHCETEFNKIFTRYE